MSTGASGSGRELAALKPARWPNEGRDCRAARTALLAEEIELRRHIGKRVALAVVARSPIGGIFVTVPGGRGTEWYPALDECDDRCRTS